MKLTLTFLLDYENNGAEHNAMSIAQRAWVFCE